MHLVRTIKELKILVRSQKRLGKVGFVPTMGALHQGHISLVETCVKENKYCVVSIYVNPTQFNDKDDLKRYPRDLEKDMQLLDKTGCDIVFSPADSEMYPESDTRKFDFGELETVMEGCFRPGHFNGVAQIVSKLFDAIEPDRAYFGLKDFQQLTIVKKLVSDYKYNIEIVPCPIVREIDGLAMSSRNLLLDPEKRKAAPFIYRTLKQTIPLSEKLPPREIKNFVKDQFDKNKELELEYFEIVDNLTLKPVSEFKHGIDCSACIAAYAGKIRLIDNIQYNS